MKITLLVVGKINEKYLNEGISLFEKRLQRYINFSFNIIPDLKNISKLTFDEQKIKEGIQIIEKIDEKDFVVLLDEKGKHFKSLDFADFIVKKQNASIKNLVFIVGGPYGFSDTVYKRANEKISLSSMTFSHQMVRLFFVEQLYRAHTIIKGEPYHHE